MRFLIPNNILVDNRPRTFLSDTNSIGDTTLTVRGVDNSVWKDDDYIIVGEIGSANAELMQISATTADGTSLTVERTETGTGLRYSHSFDEPVYRIDYNQVRFYRAATEGGSKTLLTTVPVTPNEYNTVYDDGVYTTGFGFATLYNQTSVAESPYSDAIPYTGLTERSVAKMIAEVRDHLNEQDDNYVTDEEIIAALNNRQRAVLNYRMWNFNEKERSLASVENQFDYDIDGDMKTLYSVRFNSAPLEFISRGQWERLNYDTDATAETPYGVAVFNRNMRFYPRPTQAALTSTLDSAITDSATTIDIASNTTFQRTDYYRFKINDEVIYATDYEEDGGGSGIGRFTGCTRGREDTIAAAHSSGDTVTELNIVVTGQMYATTLVDQADETVIPEPEVLTLGAAAKIAMGKLQDFNRSDRLEQSFQLQYQNLKDKFAITFIGQRQVVKLAEEVVQNQRFNPNDHPTNVIAP